MKQTGSPIVIYMLLGVNASLWLLMTIAGGSKRIPVLIRFGAQQNELVLEGQYWRLLSSMFLHIGFMHLMFNSLSLFYIGRAVELMYGKYRFMAIYTLSGFIGNILFLAFGQPRDVSAGASGAIFGILGAHIPLNRRLKKEGCFETRQAFVGVGYVIFVFVQSWVLLPNVNIHAHLGGVVTGGVLGLLLCPRTFS